MYASEIKKQARKRAQERIRTNQPSWTLRFETLKAKNGEKITESDNILYRQEISRYSER